MDFTRHHYFIAGILLFLAGFQFRYVSSFTLNEPTSQFVDRRLGTTPVLERPTLFSFSAPSPLASRRVIQPPRWLSFSLMSIGGVLFFYSLTMRKAGT